jgi:hypothetical protein
MEHHPQQVWEFKEQQPAMYTKLFEQYGWTVKKQQGTATMFFKEQTGSVLKKLIRQNFTAATWGKAKSGQKSDILGPIVCAIIDTESQKKQVQDFITRLKDQVLVIKTTALDQHVNRPAYVGSDFGKALDHFYANHMTVSKNPNQWTATNRVTYEGQILDDYGVNRRMTDAENRYNRLKDQLPIAPN